MKLIVGSHSTHTSPDLKNNIVLLAILPSVALGLLNDLYLEPLSHYGAMWFWAADIGQFVVVPGIVAFLLLRHGLTPSDFGLRTLGPSTGTVEAVGLCIFVCAVYWIAYEPIRQISYRFIWPYDGTFGYGRMLPQPPLARSGVVLYLSATAAIVEEVAFRGLPWLYFSRWPQSPWRVSIYVASTAVLFAAIHSEQGPHGVLASFCLGLVAATLYAKIQNLWPFVAAHFVSDVVSFW